MPTSLTRVSVQEARRHLEQLLDSVEQGQQVVITRPGRPAIYLKSEEETREQFDQLPTLDQWRTTISTKGKDLSHVVGEGRSEERY